MTLHVSPKRGTYSTLWLKLGSFLRVKILVEFNTGMSCFIGPCFYVFIPRSAETMLPMYMKKYTSFTICSSRVIGIYCLLLHDFRLVIVDL